ncbi:MAG: hydantoinase B/oxoprolinase family protein, partial [Alphaproteobacteria bacterium]
SGGQSGKAGKLYLKSGKDLDAKGFQLIGPNEHLCFELPGGGGFGSVKDRNPEYMIDDKRAGLLSNKVNAEDE